MWKLRVIVDNDCVGGADFDVSGEVDVDEDGRRAVAEHAVHVLVKDYTNLGVETPHLGVEQQVALLGEPRATELAGSHVPPSATSAVGRGVELGLVLPLGLRLVWIRLAAKRTD